MKNRWELLAKKLWREWIKPLAVVLVVLGSFRSAVADWNDVPTGSMKPTILEGDRIFVNKLAYDLKVPFTLWRLTEWDGPQRGDVIVFFAPDSGTRLVKRVVGLPGDRVEMRDNRLIINGRPADYGPPDLNAANQLGPDERPRHTIATETLADRAHPVMATPAVPARRSFDAVAVPPGHYLVLGDNRDNSRDSRFFGCVPREQIVGQAIGIAISLDRNHWYAPRWQRFLTALP